MQHSERLTSLTHSLLADNSGGRRRENSDDTIPFFVNATGYNRKTGVANKTESSIYQFATCYYLLYQVYHASRSTDNEEAAIFLNR